jgi:hypothetical protein
MTKIVKFDDKAVARIEEENPFTEFGKAVANKPQLILGDILRFTKGDWLVGKDLLPVDTEALAGMPWMYVGWIKWIKNKPVAQAMARVGSGLKPPKRKTLGDNDPELQPTNNHGEPEDPWKFSVYLPALLRTGNFVTFASQSRGGIKATGELAKRYGEHLKMHPDQLPLVKLGVGGYEHPKGFGWIKEPDFAPAGYLPKADFDKALIEKGHAADLPPDIVRSGDDGGDEGFDADSDDEETTPQIEAKPKPRDFDDEIPF